MARAQEECDDALNSAMAISIDEEQPVLAETAAVDRDWHSQALLETDVMLEEEDEKGEEKADDASLLEACLAVKMASDTVVPRMAVGAKWNYRTTVPTR